MPVTFTDDTTNSLYYIVYLKLNVSDIEENIYMCHLRQLDLWALHSTALFKH